MVALKSRYVVARKDLQARSDGRLGEDIRLGFIYTESYDDLRVLHALNWECVTEGTRGQVVAFILLSNISVGDGCCGRIG